MMNRTRELEQSSKDWTTGDGWAGRASCFSVFRSFVLVVLFRLGVEALWAWISIDFYMAGFGEDRFFMIDFQWFRWDGMGWWSFLVASSGRLCLAGWAFDCFPYMHSMCEARRQSNQSWPGCFRFCFFFFVFGFVRQIVGEFDYVCSWVVGKWTECCDALWTIFPFGFELANLNSTSSIKGNGERETLSPNFNFVDLTLSWLERTEERKRVSAGAKKKSVSLQLLPKRDKLDEKVNLSTTTAVATNEMDPFSLLISSGLVTPRVDIL